MVICVGDVWDCGSKLLHRFLLGFQSRETVFAPCLAGGRLCPLRRRVLPEEGHLGGTRARGLHTRV